MGYGIFFSKKTTVIPNDIKWQENGSKIIFAFGDHPRLNKIFFFTNCLTWIDWSKIIFEFGIHVSDSHVNDSYVGDSQ